jgi:hypothetical protein
VGLLIFVFLIYQWRKWNKYGWQQIHYRSMLAYAAIARREAARAQQEGREFSKINACHALARPWSAMAAKPMPMR